MLTSDEVLKIMEKDFLELQRKRIVELENAVINFCNWSQGQVDSSVSKEIEELKKVATKGMSL